MKFDKRKDAELELRHVTKALRRLHEADPLAYEQMRLRQRKKILVLFEQTNAPKQVINHQKELVNMSEQDILRMQGGTN